jgi:hypothetical protein
VDRKSISNWLQLEATACEFKCIKLSGRANPPSCADGGDAQYLEGVDDEKHNPSHWDSVLYAVRAELAEAAPAKVTNYICTY